MNERSGIQNYFDDFHGAQSTLKHRDVLDALKSGKFDDNITNVLEAAAKEISAKY